jgi:tRNA (guanine-N7-)-methyltransferase
VTSPEKTAEDQASDANPDARPADLRSFGRRRGRKPSPRQERLLRDVLPSIAFSAAQPIADPSKPLWLEIGFGGGEHLIWQAEHNPEVNILGCEPFEDGVVKVLTAREEKDLRNIFLHMDDARMVLRALPPASIHRAFILFPDPWPKRKHQKRRLISSTLLAELASVMRPGAELRIGTDIADYARTILMAFQSTSDFTWTATRPADWQIRRTDWPQTRYEDKAVREGRRSSYLLFHREG